MSNTDLPLSQAFNPKKNSLDFLRLFFAFLVIFSHSYPLGGFRYESIFGEPNIYGEIAVSSFFIISGFLITRSYQNTQSIVRFIWSRSLRVFPGLWVCLIVTILLFAPILHYEKYRTLSNYFQLYQAGPLQYLKANFLIEMKQYDINGLTLGLPFPSAFNGSLWTLVYELKCYLGIAFLGWTKILDRQKILVPILFFLFFQIYMVDLVSPGTAAKILPYFTDIYNYKLPMFFLAGAVLHLYNVHIIISKKILISFAVMIVLSVSQQSNLYHLISPFALSYAVIALAIYLPFSRIGKYGDFSYGVYIYAFPVQQLLSFFKLNQYGFTTYVMLSMLLTSFLSILSWFLVEKPSLAMKKFSLLKAISSKKSLGL